MRVIQMNPSSEVSRERVSYPPPPKMSPPLSHRPAPIFDIKSFKKDDWILLSIIAVLILEGSEDYILLCALGYLFIMGF